MPRILHKLRIDEISSVDRGAGDGCKIVLYKRDAPRRKVFGYEMPKPEPRSVYQEIFARKRDQRRDRIRHLRRHIADGGGGVQPEPMDPVATTAAVSASGNVTARISYLADLIVEAGQGAVSRSEALAWILTNRHGRAAATHLTTKREVPNMDRMTKNVIAMGEAEYTRIVTDYAKRLYPELSRERAFSKVFTADDAESVAIRKYWQISKQGVADEPADERDDDEDDTDALEELNELAEQERRRASGMSKYAAFAKVYQDNPALAAKERRQNRPRA